MSVQHNIYLMYGMKIDPETLPKDELDEPILEWGKSSSYSTKVEHKDNLFMLFDGMSGKYCILGYVIGKVDDNGDSSLDTVQEIRALNFSKEQEIRASILRNFGIIDECKYYLINHYS